MPKIALYLISNHKLLTFHYYIRRVQFNLWLQIDRLSVHPRDVAGISPGFNIKAPSIRETVSCFRDFRANANVMRMLMDGQMRANSDCRHKRHNL